MRKTEPRSFQSRQRKVMARSCASDWYGSGGGGRYRGVALWAKVGARPDNRQNPENCVQLWKDRTSYG